ncbi:MAG: toll/interleukin-1 receptor domain-containing protein, partial [Verrucomicrobiota bacterium]
MLQDEVNLAQSVPLPEFWSFISYRHSDNDLKHDQGWATWLHRQIEHYTVQAELVGTQNDRGDIIPERIYPVFRDEESLPADADLSRSITNALDRSRSLVVLCSPRATESVYVAQEITHFKKTKADRVIAAIVAGEPGDPNQECFPQPLRHPVRADGSLDLSIEEEPIAADFRLPEGGEGRTSPQAYFKLLRANSVAVKEAKRRANEYGERLELMKLKVIAGIIGVPLETLRDRDKARQLELARKRARVFAVISSVMALLLVAAAVSGWIAVLKQQESERQARAARAGEKAALYQLRREDEPLRAAELAVEAAAETLAWNEPTPAMARQAVMLSLMEVGGEALVGPSSNPLITFDVSADERWLAAENETGEILVWDLESPQKRPFRIPTQIIADSGAGLEFGRLRGFAANTLLLWNDAERPNADAFLPDFRILRTQPASWIYDSEAVSFSVGNNHALAVDGDDQIWRWTDPDGDGILEPSVLVKDVYTARRVEYSPSGNHALIEPLVDNGLWLVSFSANGTAKTEQITETEQFPPMMAWASEADAFVSAASEGGILLWQPDGDGFQPIMLRQGQEDDSPMTVGIS